MVIGADGLGMDPAEAACRLKDSGCVPFRRAGNSRFSPTFPFFPEKIEETRK